MLTPPDLTNFNDLYIIFEFVDTDMEKLIRSAQFFQVEVWLCVCMYIYVCVCLHVGLCMRVCESARSCYECL